MVAKKTEELVQNKIEHARDMYSAVIAHHGGTANPKDLARQCFHYADHFNDAEALYLSGKLEPEANLNPYDDACAPNMPKSHPINLMSKRWGNLTKAKEHLEAIGKLDRSRWRDDVKPDDIVYEDARWNVAQVLTAEQLLPGFIRRFEKCEQEKAAIAKKRMVAEVAETV